MISIANALPAFRSSTLPILEENIRVKPSLFTSDEAWHIVAHNFPCTITILVELYIYT
jgi:hypothetical protein